MNKNSKGLFVLLSDHWGARERNLLKDARDLESENIVYCLRDSVVDIEARKLNLPIIYFKGFRFESPLNLRNFLELKKIISSHKFDFIYCAHLGSLWLLCFILRNNTMIKLIFHGNGLLKKNYKTFIYAFLERRIDQFLIPAEVHKNAILEKFKVSSKRINSIGLGVEPFSKKSKSKDFDFYLSILVPNHIKRIEPYEILFYTFNSVIDELATKDKKIRINFLTEKPWGTHILYNELQEKAVLFGLDQNVFFESIVDDGHLSADIWLDLGEDILESFFALQALASKVPILTARTPMQSNLFCLPGGHGESFKPQDSRDLRSKCLKILNNHSKYLKAAAKIAPTISQDHCRQTYFAHLNTAFHELGF